MPATPTADATDKKFKMTWRRADRYVLCVSIDREARWQTYPTHRLEKVRNHECATGVAIACSAS